MFFADDDWIKTPIEYEIVEGQCSYCGSDGEYFDPELAGVLPDDEGNHKKRQWYCPLCEDYNLQIEQGTLEA